MSAQVTSRYTGPAYPFGPSPAGVFGPKGDAAVVLTSILNILTTPKGTLPYAPRLGSMIPALLFEPNDDVTRALIRHYAVKEISEQEPRAVVRGVIVEKTDDHTIRIIVSFSVVGDPTGATYQTPAYFGREWEA